MDSHGAALLLLIREGEAKDWNTLCKAFEYDPRYFRSGHLGLKGAIEDLVDAGLIQSEDRYRGPYTLTESAQKVIYGLGLSLTQAANIPYHTGIGVQPMFGKPARLDEAPHVFVAMPFAASLRPVFNGPIKKACRELRLSVERGDDIFSASSIVDDIWAAIYNAGAMVADCTTRNANVFYEIGIAHTLGKPVVLISQSDEDVPFDVAYLRYIRYATTVSGLRKLQTALRKTLKEVGKGIWS